MLKSEANKSC